MLSSELISKITTRMMYLLIAPVRTNVFQNFPAIASLHVCVLEN